MNSYMYLNVVLPLSLLATVGLMTATTIYIIRNPPNGKRYWHVSIGLTILLIAAFSRNIYIAYNMD